MMGQLVNDLITIVNNIGLGFCNHAASIFIQSSILIVLLLAVNFLLRKRVRAVFRYCLWMLVFVKLILPSSLALPTGIGYWLGDYWPSEPPVSAQMPVIEPVTPITVAPAAATEAKPPLMAPVEPTGAIRGSSTSFGTAGANVNDGVGSAAGIWADTEG